MLLDRERLAHTARHWAQRVGRFLQWLVLGAAIGAGIGGLIGTAFYYVLQGVTQLRVDNHWLLCLLPLGGVAIVFIYRVCGVEKSRGTDLVLLAVRSPEPLPARMGPLIFAATALTHLFGGSAGREGAALQLGGSLGYGFGRLLKRGEKELHVLTMCGMASVFSALFGTPVVAAVFAMEVITVGEMYYSALVPIAVASMAASGVAHMLGAVPVRFQMLPQAAPQLLPALQVLALAALCAGLAILFCKLLKGAGLLYQRLFPNPYIRVLAGGVLVAALLFLCGRDYEGAGTDVIARAVQGQARPEAFFLKMLLTALTLGAGFKGGEIVPSFYIGATFGCWMAGLLGMDPALGAAVGLVCVFSGVTNCPLTGLLLGCSLFGYSSAPYFFLAAAVSYALSGYNGLYKEQTILYSKFRPAYINKKLKGKT